MYPSDDGHSFQPRVFRPFLCGDVMTGRGIDQVLPHPCPPLLFEPFVRDARQYVALAERENGPVQLPVPFDYVWGEALPELAAVHPDLRLINLETAVTTSSTPWPDKGVHYRMHPANLQVLAALGTEVAVLANNHVLDWGRKGLEETLSSLRKTGIATAGAGEDMAAATTPAVAEWTDGRRILVFAFGSACSGIPENWAADRQRSGVALLPDLSSKAAELIGQRVAAVKKPDDLVIASIHWGSNWGYAVPREQQRFARNLLARAGVDLVHGHSSHHPRPLEVYRGKLIIYGCGDFLNDYEGISGFEAFRPELTLMYFPSLAPATGQLLQLRMVPLRIRNFRLAKASLEDGAWLATMLTRAGKPFGTAVRVTSDHSLQLSWKDTG